MISTRRGGYRPAQLDGARCKLVCKNVCDRWAPRVIPFSSVQGDLINPANEALPRPSLFALCALTHGARTHAECHSKLRFHGRSPSVRSHVFCPMNDIAIGRQRESETRVNTAALAIGISPTTLRSRPGYSPRALPVRSLQPRPIVRLEIRQHVYRNSHDGGIDYRCVNVILERQLRGIVALAKCISRESDATLYSSDLCLVCITPGMV